MKNRPKTDGWRIATDATGDGRISRYLSPRRHWFIRKKLELNTESHLAVSRLLTSVNRGRADIAEKSLNFRA